MEFKTNYITFDKQFRVFLPIEFNLLLTKPSEVFYHRKQIKQYRLFVYNIKTEKKSSRILYIDNHTNRVFFTRRINQAAPRNTIYYLDELIKLS
jgi:hypothetical protein